MKRFLFGSAAIVFLNMAGSALAADMPVKARPAPAAVEYSWTSCYVGANAGWKQGRFRESVDTPAGTAVIPGLGTTPFVADHLDLGSLTRDSGVIGGQIGCRWESPEHWVFGVEGDGDWSNLHGRVTARTAGTGNSVFVPGDFFDNRARWQASLRGVVGHSWDRTLVYATGGIAFTGVRMDGDFIATTVAGIPFPASTGSDSRTLFGLTVGAGAAYALTNNWEIGAEYRYTAYRSDDFALGSVAAVCGFVPGAAVNVACVNTNATGHKDLRTQEVLVKLNYRFDWVGGPVVARY